MKKIGYKLEFYRNGKTYKREFMNVDHHKGVFLMILSNMVNSIYYPITKKYLKVEEE